VNMRIYELRVDGVDCYYSLGLSASLEALKQQVEAMDGPAHEYAHGTEQLEIYARELGELQSDCAAPGVLVCSAKRYSYVSDDDKLKWRTEWAADADNAQVEFQEGSENKK